MMTVTTRWNTALGVAASLWLVGCSTDERPSTTSGLSSASVGISGSGGNEETGQGQGRDDGSGAATSGSSGEASSSGSQADTTSSDPAATSANDTTGGGQATDSTGSQGETSGDPLLDACLEVAADDCEQCGCMQCLDPLFACEMDEGCVAIRDCAQQSGCTDDVSCYEACEDIINQFGGPFGTSVGLAVDLAECLEGSCPACF